MNCEYCDCIYINGVKCHETGCPMLMTRRAVEEWGVFEELEERAREETDD